MIRALLASFIAIVAMALFLALYLSSALPRQRPIYAVAIDEFTGDAERGEYLYNNVLLCNDCHSARDWTKFGAPTVKPDGAGRGCVSSQTEVTGVLKARYGNPGFKISPEDNFPARLCMPNITPDKESGIGSWTDAELIRAIREGINKDGQAMFPAMPYLIYRNISDEDVMALVAYMRTMEPAKIRPEVRLIDFPLNLLVQIWPRPLIRPVKAQNPENKYRVGAYLAAIARCEYCHTPRWGQGLEGSQGKLFGGGVPFLLEDNLLFSTNLTPHVTGIKDWGAEEFIARFRKHQKGMPGDQKNNSWMNWEAYSGMTDEDLGAIFYYLKRLKPVRSTFISELDN